MDKPAISDEMLAKIRKVAALADRAGTEDEAIAANLMMQKLLNKHGLSAEDIAMEDAITKEVIDGLAEQMGKRTAWKGQLAMVIGNNFRVVTYWSHGYNWESGKNTASLRFIGLTQDVEAAVAMYNTTVKAIYRFSDEYTNTRWKKDMELYGYNTWDRSKSILMGNSYKIGFIDGLADAFRAQVADKSNAIVLVKDPMVDEKVKSMNMGRTAPSNANFGYSYDAQARGRMDGKNFAGNGGRELKG